MIRYFCDRCGKRMPFTEVIRIEASSPRTSAMAYALLSPGRRYDVCEPCFKKLFDPIEKKMSRRQEDD